MAINLGLNIRTNSKSSQTVSVVASSGVTLASISSTNKRLTVSATENVAKELCTVTFTAGTNLYYSKEPEFVQNFTDATLSFTSSVTKNSLGRVITKTFVISATASINSIYNILTFSEKISVSSVAGVNNSVLKQIDNINFNTSEVISSGETRLLKVSGKQNTQFSVKLTRSTDSKTYDFDTGTFTTSATTSGTKKITSSGVVDLPIILPSSSVLETYTLETTADEQSVSKLDSSLQDTSGGLVNTLTFKQAISASVTFTCVSANSAYTGTHGSKPSSTAISGQSGSSSDAVNFIELSPKLHTKAFKKGKEIELNDFQFITTQAMSGSTTDTPITLTAANDQIVPGMVVTGTGITNEGITVESISGTALVLSGTPGGTVSGTLTFTGSGPDMIQQSTGLLFGVSSSDNSKLADFVVNDVSKTANANSTGTTITLANAEDDAVGTVVGVYTEQSTIANSANAGGRLVSSVDSSQNTIVVNANTTIRSGQVITFTNAGRVAEISFALTIIQFPTKNTTVSIALDNLLTIDPNWS
jgi:hypothetical protein